MCFGTGQIEEIQGSTGKLEPAQGWYIPVSARTRVDTSGSSNRTIRQSQLTTVHKRRGNSKLETQALLLLHYGGEFRSYSWTISFTVLSLSVPTFWFLNALQPTIQPHSYLIQAPGSQFEVIRMPVHGIRSFAEGKQASCIPLFHPRLTAPQQMPRRQMFGDEDGKLEHQVLVHSYCYY